MPFPQMPPVRWDAEENGTIVFHGTTFDIPVTGFPLHVEEARKEGYTEGRADGHQEGMAAEREAASLRGLRNLEKIALKIQAAMNRVASLVKDNQRLKTENELLHRICQKANIDLGNFLFQYPAQGMAYPDFPENPAN